MPLSCSSERNASSALTPPGRRIDSSAAVRRRRPEQLQRLVDEVAAEIEDDPGALAGRGRVLPALAELRRPALERRLEAMHVAERALAEQLADGEEVAVPAAILEDDERQPGRAAAAMSCSASATDAAKGLSMTRAAPEASADEALLEVHVRGRAEHDEVEALREQFLGRCRRSRLRDDPGGLRTPGRVARRDGLDREARVGGDERSVEDASGEAVADDRRADRGAVGHRARLPGRMRRSPGGLTTWCGRRALP